MASGLHARAALPTDAELERLRRQADPLADDTVAAMLMPWDGHEAENLTRLAAANRALSTWTRNRDLDGWQAPADTPAPIADALRTYTEAARALPDWADPALIACAERLFMSEGVLSCTLLFCASLPECYVMPDLAEVLHTTGQLEQRTEHRIRATAAMIFPVMLDGGLTTPDGSGVAVVLKVRLIHAMVRHLVLRGTPTAAVAGRRHVRRREATAVAPAGAPMHRALLTHGWDVAADGLPCNQLELAYTLLTFGYVYARGLRTLGVGLPAGDERAVMHAWNVVGHLVGIQPGLMQADVDAATPLFEALQAYGRRHLPQPDPRPPLAAALMRSMADVLTWRVLRPIPILMTRMLCGRVARDDLGLNRRVGVFSRALFATGLALVRLVDTIGRTIRPGFSTARLVTRIVGYRLLTRLLMDQTRPLMLPSHLLPQVAEAMGRWGHDPAAPGWINTLEDRFTERGRWTSA